MKRLTVLTLIAALILSCTKNHPPIIDNLVAEPDSVYPGDTVVLKFQSSDLDNHLINSNWFCDFGKWVTENHSWGEPVEWIAPYDPGEYYIKLTISDLENETTDSIKVIVLDTTGTFIDSRDGHEYKWVKIGEQFWMAENLAWLPEVTHTDTSSATKKCYYVCGYYGEDVSEARATEFYSAYGVWYNWLAATDGDFGTGEELIGGQGGCPPGWHLPADQEWFILEMYLGMEEGETQKDGWRYSGDVGAKLKEAGTTHWADPNYGATDSVGFTALPAGGRYITSGGCSLTKGKDALFWTATAYNSTQSWYRSLSYLDRGVGRHRYYDYGGFSVRCLKN